MENFNLSLNLRVKLDVSVFSDFILFFPKRPSRDC